MSELLVAEEISKVVGWLKKETIVDRVSIRLNAGEIMGFLGPNGAGKTTTRKMLLGLTSITSGSARIFGAPVPAPASRIGVYCLNYKARHGQTRRLPRALEAFQHVCDFRDPPPYAIRMLAITLAAMERREEALKILEAVAASPERTADQRLSDQQVIERIKSGEKF